ncbi:hypothetical protein [Bacillus cereus]|uniref:Uncharacterized protein n=1 Tax=Bacillus cereus VD184 TaxID=1053242 RepID=A0A9W5VPU8_BACCE|nr:hypothetical protein [Bacillus cereus]EOQ02077.1 hypothetical protein IKC_04759 [Bacillus cereus VD184]
MLKNKLKNYVKVFVLYFIILILYYTLFEFGKEYMELRVDSVLLPQLYLAVGRMILGLLIWFLPDKLGIKVHFICKIIIYIITMILTLIFLDVLGLLD